MKLNWFQRSVYNYKRIEVAVDRRQYIYIDRLMHAVNFYRSRIGDDEEVTISTVARRFVLTGLEQALDKGIASFTKAFTHRLETNRFEHKKGSFAKIVIDLHASELKALEDITAMTNECLEDEHLYHDQTYLSICRDDIIRYFISLGNEGFKNTSVAKTSSLLEDD